MTLQGTQMGQGDPPHAVTKQRSLLHHLRLSRVLHSPNEQQTIHGTDNDVTSPIVVDTDAAPDTCPDTCPVSTLSSRRLIPLRKSRTVGMASLHSDEINRNDTDKTNSQNPMEANRTKRIPKTLKLKFHHQALPPQYLDHYQATLRRESAQTSSQTTCGTSSLPPSYLALPSPREGISSVVPRAKRPSRGKPRPITIHEAGQSGATAALQEMINIGQCKKLQQTTALARAQSVPSVMCHSATSIQRELSVYNGCDMPELIRNDDRETTRKSKRNGSCSNVEMSNTNLQLSSESHHMNDSFMQSNHTMFPCTAPDHVTHTSVNIPEQHYNNVVDDTKHTEPLNLCIRDGNNSNNTPIFLLPLVPDNHRMNETQNSSLDSKSDYRNCNMQSNCSAIQDEWHLHTPHWWYDYRQPPDDGMSSGHSTPSLCSQSSHLPSMSPPIFPYLTPPHKFSNHPLSPPFPFPRGFFPRSPSPVPASPSSPQLLSTASYNRMRETLTTRENNGENIPLPQPTTAACKSSRRRRSTLFLAPSVESGNTEVNLGKFKFTAGPNPTLEEKRMVRVDAEGTVHYSCHGGGETSHGAASGGTQLQTGQWHSNRGDIQDPVKKMRLERRANTTVGETKGECSPIPQLEADPDSPKRKRRSKKSSVRERLERTLAERGLLIQTQQVESPEGATYCKFRQLRKFTRYLFRSWKEYLPGQLGEPTVELFGENGLSAGCEGSIYAAHASTDNRVNSV